MRRVVATLLLFIFGSALIAPMLFASDPESKLPPCCRRNGKHHCAMMGSPAESSSGPALQASRCAAFPMAAGVAASPLVSLPAVSQTSVPLPITRPVLRPQTQSLSRSSVRGGRQKRGPPTLAS